MSCWTTCLPLCWLLLAAVSGIFPASAKAYCRTTTCSACPRDPDTGCTVGGLPLAWPEACLSFSMQEAASQQIDLVLATALMAEAFATWEAASCNSEGATPSIHVSDAFGPSECSEPQYNPYGGNSNLIVFRDEVWPYMTTGNTLALTSVTSNSQGLIYDADMEINGTLPLDPGTSASVVLPGIVTGVYDLRSILVHEAGHFLGLDHSTDLDSIMRVSLEPGEVRTRLADDDIAAICAIYPPERTTTECAPGPRGGFSRRCHAIGPITGGCSLQRQARSTLAPLALWVFALLAFRARRK